MSDTAVEPFLSTDHLFNVVILPVTAASGETPQLFQLSAGRRDGALRLISPHWTEREVRDAFAALQLPLLQVEELLRGNTMAFGPRTRRRIYFTPTQLQSIGLTPAPPPPEADLS